MLHRSQIAKDFGGRTPRSLAPPPDFTHEGVVGRHSVWHPVINVDAKQLAEKEVEVLSTKTDALLDATISDRDVKKPSGPNRRVPP